MGETARSVAVSALAACRKAGAWSEAALHIRIERAGLEPRDAALASRLCYGVLQNRAWIDYALGRVSHTPVEKLEPRVLDILRISVYQMTALDRIPHSAAVDEAVSLTRAVGSPRAAGLVNAVLRKVSAWGGELPEPPRDDPAAYLAVRYSHPRWLVERFVELLGPADAEALLAANNAETPVYAQVNTLKTDTGAALAALRGAGVEAEAHPWLPDCLTLKGAGKLENLPPFTRGEIYIQDPAARLALLAADPHPGDRVLDVCAAPGGKSFAAAIRMGGRGEILAADIHEKKLGRIRSGAERLGISIIETRAADARTFTPELEAAFDLVIVDAPCSGLGVIRKKPEIRERRPEAIAGLPDIQLDILRTAARYVRPGGGLLYCTCTLLPEENGLVTRAFLTESGDFFPIPHTLPGGIGGEAGETTLYPHIHGTDGFFLCTMRRRDP